MTRFPQVGRPREFDMDSAMQGAMEIFWRQGYKATNLPDLLTAMGLTRGSFYKAFGDKMAVYLAALDRYEAEVIAKGGAALDACTSDSAADCLALLFDAPKDPRLGCFICNAMVEMAPTDADVAAKTREMSDQLTGAIARVLRRTGYGDDAAPLADLVLHLYYGDQAMCRANGARGDWRGALERVLR